MIVALLLLQVAPPAPAPAAAPPDIQLNVDATVRRVMIENDGRVDLQLRTSVNGRQGEQNVIEVEAPEVPQGRSTLNDVTVRVRAEARIQDPLAPASEPQQEQEPAPPQ